MINQQRFQNEYWTGHTQQLEARHKLALEQCKGATSILDVACGDGLFLQHCTAHAKMGLDISPIAQAKAKERGVKVIVDDFESESTLLKMNRLEWVDCVTALDVIEHTLQPVELLKKMGNNARYVVVTTPNFASIIARTQCLLGKIPSVSNERKGHTFYYTKKKLAEVFDRAGLTIISWTYYFPLDNRTINPLRWVFKLRPSLFATEFCVKAERKKR